MYITKVDDNLLVKDGDKWKIDPNWSGGFSDIAQGSEYFEHLSAKSSNGTPQVAKEGEKLTAHIPGGGKVSGTYVGPIEISMPNGFQRVPYDYGYTDVFYGAIKGHVIQGDDGNTYIIGDLNVSDYGIPLSGGVNIDGIYYPATGKSPEELKKTLLR